MPLLKKRKCCNDGSWRTRQRHLSHDPDHRPVHRWALWMTLGQPMLRGAAPSPQPDAVTSSLLIGVTFLQRSAVSCMQTSGSIWDATLIVLVLSVSVSMDIAFFLPLPLRLPLRFPLNLFFWSCCADTLQTCGQTRRTFNIVLYLRFSLQLVIRQAFPVVSRDLVCKCGFDGFVHVLSNTTLISASIFLLDSLIVLDKTSCAHASMAALSDSILTSLWLSTLDRMCRLRPMLIGSHRVVKRFQNLESTTSDVQSCAHMSLALGSIMRASFMSQNWVVLGR